MVRMERSSLGMKESYLRDKSTSVLWLLLACLINTVNSDIFKQIIGMDLKIQASFNYHIYIFINVR